MLELKRFIIVTMWILILVLTACEASHAVPKGYYSYNDDKVALAMDQLQFQPALPEYIPFDMITVVSDIYYEEETEIMDLSFYTPENDLLTITFIDGDSLMKWSEPEDLSITEQMDGVYKNNRYSKKLAWQKDGITYVLTYRANKASEENNGQSVTLQQLVEVARSFHK